MSPNNKQSFGNVIVGIFLLFFVGVLLYNVIGSFVKGFTVIGLILVLFSIVIIALPVGFAGVHLICSYFSSKKKNNGEE